MNQKRGFEFSSAGLHILAMLFMLCDHLWATSIIDGDWLTCVGRLAFPIYAYCIAEGFRYTRNRLKYFLGIFILGTLCQTVYTIVDGELYFGVLITFSISIVIMYFVDCFKNAIDREDSHIAKLYFALTKSKFIFFAESL